MSVQCLKATHRYLVSKLAGLVSQRIQGGSRPSAAGKLTLCAAALLIPGNAHSQLSVYFGEDGGLGNVWPNNSQSVSRPTNHVQSARAAAAFTARLPGVLAESFEGFADGSMPTVVHFGTNTATLSGSRSVVSVTDPLTTWAGGGLYPITGTNMLYLQATAPGFFVLKFDTPQAAFGFFGTDLGEPNGLRVAVITPAGTTNSWEVPITRPAASASSFFFGIIDKANPFVRVEFSRVGADTTDGFGFDDFTIATPEQVTTTANLYVAGLGGMLYGYAVTPDSATLLEILRDPAVQTPIDVTFSRWGELFVSTSSQHPYLFEERPGFVRRYAAPYGVSHFSGDLGAGALVTPHGLAFRGDELLATDPGNNRVRRYRFGPRGEPEELPSITSSGFVNEAVRWVVAKPDGSEVLVSQCICGGVNNVRRFRFEPNGSFSDQGLLPGSFNNPHGMAFSPWGELFTANSDRVLEGSQFTNWFISRHTFAPEGTPNSNGSITHPKLHGSIALAFSPWGELFVNNQTASSITRFVFTPDHVPVYNGTISLPSDGAGLAFRPSGSCTPVGELSLSITVGANAVSATFPASAAEYSLDWTDSLTPPVVWRPTYAARGNMGLNLQVTLPLGSGTNRAEFYRLRCPNY